MIRTRRKAGYRRHNLTDRPAKTTPPHLLSSRTLRKRRRRQRLSQAWTWRNRRRWRLYLSTRTPGMSFRRSRVLPITLLTKPSTTRTGLTSTSIGAPRNSCRKRFSLGSLATSSTEVTGDSGPGAKLGPFQSSGCRDRTAARLRGTDRWYARIYRAEMVPGVRRAELGRLGWNFWLTFAISPVPLASSSPSPQAMAYK